MFSYFRWLRSGSLCPKWIIRENTGKQKYWMKAAVSNHKTHVYRRQSLVKSDYKIQIKKEANITPYLQNYLGASICCSTQDSCRQHDYGTRYGAIQASLHLALISNSCLYKVVELYRDLSAYIVDLPVGGSRDQLYKKTLRK